MLSFQYPMNIRFKCIKCGICCGNTEKKTRHILLLQKEANKIADAIKQPIDSFAIEIVGKSPYCYEMKKTKEGKCIFLKRNRCILYSKRPLICKYYPFGLETHEDQQKIFYTNECSGIGKGKIIRQSDFHRLIELANKTS